MVIPPSGAPPAIRGFFVGGVFQLADTSKRISSFLGPYQEAFLDANFTNKSSFGNIPNLQKVGFCLHGKFGLFAGDQQETAVLAESDGISDRPGQLGGADGKFHGAAGAVVVEDDPGIGIDPKRISLLALRRPMVFLQPLPVKVPCLKRKQEENRQDRFHCFLKNSHAKVFIGCCQPMGSDSVLRELRY